MNNINDSQKELASNKNKLKLLYQKQIQEHKNAIDNIIRQAKIENIDLDGISPLQNIKDNIGVIPFNNNSTAWWICHFIKQGNLEPVLHNGKLVFKVDTIIYLLKSHGKSLGSYQSYRECIRYAMDNISNAFKLGWQREKGSGIYYIS